MTLEPPGLDPTAGAASAIAEITLYNVYETLTKIGSDSKVTGCWPRAGRPRPT
jgi:peptide/nickel transport system substrate-binding protein